MKGIIVCGGDLRQVGCANFLAEMGYRTFVYMVEPERLLTDKVSVMQTLNFEMSDTLILPLPVTDDDKFINCASEKKPILEDFFEKIPKNLSVYGGKCSPYVKGIADRQNITIKDYLNDESFSIKNAYLTAEGAIKIAIDETKRGLLGVKVLVVGFGRIGKCLSHLLKNMGADVCTSARKKSDLAWILNYGYKNLETKNIKEYAENFDIIFNTVPKRVLNPDEIPQKTLYIELASKPYGTDLEEAKKLNKKIILASSLPGKITPIAAGRAIAETVINMEQEGRE